MGNPVSKVYRFLLNVNAQNRALRYVEKAEKTKPNVAPRYPTEQRTIEQLLHDHPEIADEIQRKDPKLEEHLKHVHVESRDVAPVTPIKSTRALPTRVVCSEDASRDSVYGLPELPPDKVPPGKLTFREAVDFMESFQAAPNRRTFHELLEQSRLSEDEMKSMFRFFALYQSYKNVKLIHPAKQKFLKGFHGLEIVNPHIKDVQDYLLDKKEELTARRDLRLEQERQKKAEEEIEINSKKKQEQQNQEEEPMEKGQQKT